MLVMIEMGTGKRLMEPKEEYGEEVLFANWLPQPEPGLALQEAVPAKTGQCEPPLDADAFLRAVYLSQE